MQEIYGLELLSLFLPLVVFCWGMFAMFFLVMLKPPHQNRIRTTLFFFVIAAIFFGGGLYFSREVFLLIIDYTDLEELLLQLLFRC